MVAAQFLKLSGLSDQTLGKVRRKQCVLKRGALACSGNLILANMLGCIARHYARASRGGRISAKTPNF